MQLDRLAGAASAETEEPTDSPARERMRSAVANVTGIWAGRGTTDDLMNLTRGED